MGRASASAADIGAKICTRAVPGYHLVLQREYSRYDVIKTIQRALAAHRPRTFTLPDMGYDSSGFPSDKLPELFADLPSVVGQLEAGLPQLASNRKALRSLTAWLRQGLGSLGST